MIRLVRGKSATTGKENWPAAPGSYLLVAKLPGPERLRIGALGERDFPAGTYVYCGSALGPGGERARVRRHAEGASRAHWHIDFLLPRALVQAVWVRTGLRRLECEWAGALARHGDFGCVLPRFGASDCRCRSHLWLAHLGATELDSALRRLPFPPRLFWRFDGGRAHLPQHAGPASPCLPG